MCLLCAARNPRDPLAGIDTHAGESGGSVLPPDASFAPWTLDQIAGQLTDGYWNQPGGGGPRSFDLGPNRTLTYDVSGLETQAQVLARHALQAWTDVSGIRFVEIRPTSGTTVQEGVTDARENTSTTDRIGIGQSFVGTISSGSDEDWVRVTLQAGRTYTITLEGEGTNALSDPYLRLFNAAGVQIAANDDTNGLNSQIIFTVPAGQGGTYYLGADGYSEPGFDATGRYRMQITEGSGADITFDDEEAGVAYSTSVVSGGTILSSFVNVSRFWDSDPISVNSYWFQTYVHEIGHALGLGHAGNYNGSAEWGSDNLYDNDSWMVSIMSYFSQTDNPNVPGSYAYLATVMPADIIAIQNLYGTDVTTRAGNTVYGVNSNVTGYLDALFAQALGERIATPGIYIDNPIALTIYDTGGVDTINLSTVNARQVINLNDTATSSIGGLTSNMVIARGVVIENATGGRANDRIIGNEAANVLRGGNGVDVLQGNLGRDRLFGDAGADRLEGGGGNDLLVGGVGGDRLVGGAGIDTASYALATARVSANLQAPGTNAGEAAGDSYSGIESLIGSRHSDRLSGNSAANTLTGGAGNDILAGLGGNDTMNGGAGSDTFLFNAGRDVILGFADNVDELVLDRDLWGGGSLSFRQVLNQFADFVNNAVVFEFAPTQILVVRGVANEDQLLNDMVFV